MSSPYSKSFMALLFIAPPLWGALFGAALGRALVDNNVAALVIALGAGWVAGHLIRVQSCVHATRLPVRMVRRKSMEAEVRDRAYAVRGGADPSAEVEAYRQNAGALYLDGPEYIAPIFDAAQHRHWLDLARIVSQMGRVSRGPSHPNTRMN